MSLLEPQVFLSPGSIAAAIETTVANIDSPTELNSLGTSQGELRIARTTQAGDSNETLYYLDTTSSAQDLPYIVTSATAGLKWMAMAGYAHAQALKLKVISTSTPVMTFGNINAYSEINNQNLASGASASSDLVVTADNGTSTTHYVDLGINGSTGGAAPFTTANGAYLYTTDNQLDLSAQGASGAINLSVGATPTILAVFDVTSGVTFNDKTTATKQLRLQIANQTAATIFTFDTGAQTVSRTLSVPVLGANDTIETLATAQTITGAKTFSNTIKGTKSGSGTSAALVLEGGDPIGTAWNFTGGAVNAKLWDLIVTTNEMRWRTDIDAGGASITWMSIIRSGTAITSITLGNATSGQVIVPATTGVTVSVASTNVGSITTAGGIQVAGGSTTNPTYNFTSATTSGMTYSSGVAICDAATRIATFANGSVTFSTAAPTTFQSTTDATSSSTGAVQNSGGQNIAKNLIHRQGRGAGITRTATAAATTTLTSTSTEYQEFTGATTQIVQFPAANLFGAGIAVIYVINNQSTNTVTPTRAGSDTFAGGGTTDPVVAGACTRYASDGISVWLKC